MTSPWYYISRRTAQTAFFDPDVVDQQVRVVSFDGQGVVKARITKFCRTVWRSPGSARNPAPGRELSFLEQLSAISESSTAAVVALVAAGAAVELPGSKPHRPTF
jgi:outer membrane protein assembly factor BamE (lipoprotein component of BamABCDE complex)